MYQYNIPTIPVDVQVEIELDYLSLALLSAGLFVALLLALFAYSKM